MSCLARLKTAATLAAIAIALSLGHVATATATATAITNTKSCETLQDALFAKDSLEVRVIFGYKDARPARYVGDRHEKAAFVERLTGPCRTESQACEFVQSATDSELFVKVLKVGQGAHQSSKEIRVYVVNSAVGSDDEENLDDPFQAWKSRHAQNSFLRGLEKADVVFYNGHSRFGGGPDFKSPTLAKDGSIDPRPYKKGRNGLNQLLTALEDSQKPKLPRYSGLKVLGLFSCSSSQHFNTQIKKVSDAALMSSTNLMYYTDALNQSLSALDTLLERRCPVSLTF